jgi:hypothetical protein
MSFVASAYARVLVAILAVNPADTAVATAEAATAMADQSVAFHFTLAGHRGGFGAAQVR